MKLFLLSLLVAVAAAAPLEDSADPVEVIVNGVPAGEALEIGDIVDIKLKELVDGEIANTNDLLFPLTAQGIAEIAAAEAAAQPEAILVVEEAVNEPEFVILPMPVVPEVPAPIELPVVPTPEVTKPELPEPVVLPQPVVPEVAEPVELPTPIELPAPELVVPEVVLPEVVAPEVPVPEPQPQVPAGEVYNDGVVQVTVNTPEDLGVVATLQSWVSMVFNYFNGGVQTSQQIL